MSNPSMSDVHTPNAGGKKPKRTFKDYWTIRRQTKEKKDGDVDKDYFAIRQMTKEFAPLEQDFALSQDGKEPKKKPRRSFKDYWEIRRQTKGCGSKPMSKTLTDVTVRGDIVKVNEEQHLVAGWASVIEENGQPIVDWQGDVISEQELVKAAHDFISKYRVSKTMHEGQGTGEVVESVVFTKTMQQALGIDLGKVGWMIVTKVSDPETWEKVKSGELKAFSIGGKGVRTEIEEA